MALIERTEYHVIEGEDEYGEAVAWCNSLQEAKDKIYTKYGEGHIICKVTYFCKEYEVVS